VSLRHVQLRDFILVEALELDFADGFTALTGETGAGKSLLIDALQLALGSRSDALVVREGAAFADITAAFDSPAVLNDWLREAGFEPDALLLLRRRIERDGRSRAWINGLPATATQLRQAGEALLDIHGQHAWQSLMRADAVRALLDAYGAISTLELAQRWRAWRDARAALEAANASRDQAQAERERLAWQIGELGKLAPREGEWETLGAEHARAANAQALVEAAQGALDALQNSEKNTVALLDDAHDQLQKLEHIEPAFQPIAESLASCLAQAADAAHSLRQWLRHADLDPARLAELDARMGQWMGLSRRLRRPPGELAQALAQWEAELAAWDRASDTEALANAERQAARQWREEAVRVSAARQAAAPRLAAEVTQAMQGLGMAGGRFEVELAPLAEPAPGGLEAPAFLVAGHAGAVPRSVGKVASGGELSRLSLAIAVTTSRLGTAPTLIFDEVDSGIGGAVADDVGRLLRQLGADRQVLAVTHLAQVAACAHRHLVVSKRAQADGVRSEVAPVEGPARVAELARMAGGDARSPAALAHAGEMLARAGGAPVAASEAPARQEDKARGRKIRT